VMRGLLSKMAAVWAIGIQAVLFGAAHFDPDFGRESLGLIIALTVSGVGLGLGCYLLRRLGPVIIAHAVMNAVAITVVLNR
jgi:membrane protease YdiL (CAAX protease family)